MAPHYSNGSAFQAFHGSSRRDLDSTSLLDDLTAFLSRCARALWRFWKGRGRRMLFASLARALHQARRNMTAARLLSVPHLLVAIAMIMLLWGERWVFRSTVERCHWSDWENWVCHWPFLSILPPSSPASRLRARHGAASD